MGVPELEAIDPGMDSPGDPKVTDISEKRIDESPDRWVPPNEWLERLVAEYGGQHGGDTETLPAGSDPNRAAVAIFTMNEDESVKMLRSIIEAHRQDYSFDQTLLHRLTELVEGSQACGMEEGEWAYVTCKTAGLLHNWSPYAEVRAVTLPYDDPDEPCESIRAYVLGFFWVCVCTAINTCESYSSFPAPLQVALLTSSSLCSSSAWNLYP
jgi:hypothetical protein